MSEAKNKKTFLVISGSLVIGLVILGFIMVGKRASISNSSEKNSQESPNKRNEDHHKDPSPSDPLPEKDNCPFNEQSISWSPTLSPYDRGKYMQKEELVEWRKIPRDYIIKLWKGGYHWMDICQLWGWNLPEKDIPNLKEEKRTGVINELAVTLFHPQATDRNLSKEERNKLLAAGEVGFVRNLVIIRRKIPDGGPKINIDKNIQNQSAEDQSNTRKYVQKLVNFSLGQEKDINSQQYEISVLLAIGAEHFRKEQNTASALAYGKSNGSAIYLALLSALYNKPISKQVAATGWVGVGEKKGKYQINGQVINFDRGANLPIAGIKAKAVVCAAEGVNKLVLSKYQSSPNLLSQKLKERQEWELVQDYQALVPAEIKAKMSVYFTENTRELRELVFSGDLD